MVSNGPRELAVLDQASRMLAEASTLEGVKSIRDRAEAARTYARAAQLGLEVQNRAAELKIRAERKAGHYLTALKLRGGDRKSNGARVPLKLNDLGISAQQSKRWQRVASVPEKDFCHYLKTATELGEEVTSAGLVRISRRAAEQRSARAAGAGGRPAATYLSTENCDDIQDVIVELLNHCHLLGDVLRPVYEGRSDELNKGERRIVGRLLGEMEKMLQQLRKERNSLNSVSLC